MQNAVEEETSFASGGGNNLTSWDFIAESEHWDD